MKQHVDATPPPPIQLRPEIPQPLSDYLQHLLAKDPAHRPTAGQTADWLATQHQMPAPAEPNGTTFMPAPLTPPAPIPHTGKSRTAAHSRPHGRRKLASKAALYGTGLALFGAAAALGASLNSGDDTPASPPSPTPATATSTPEGRTPTPPSATPAATTPPAQDQGDDQGHERPGKHGDGKGKGQHSND